MDERAGVHHFCERVCEKEELGKKGKAKLEIKSVRNGTIESEVLGTRGGISILGVESARFPLRREPPPRFGLDR